MNDRAWRFFRTFLIVLLTAVFAGACLADTSGDAKTQKEIAQIRKGAEHGYVQQQIELAAAYLTGRGVPQDLSQAAHWYRKAAEAGDADAQNLIGYFCQHGIGVPVDLDRAFHWYQLGAASGSLPAKVNLGVAYINGMGVPKNPSTARQLFLEAAEKGQGLGAAYLGDIYLFGIDVPRDLAEAEKWFAMGVRLHDPIAAFGLASLLSTVPEHDPDTRRAAELLRFSASKGYVPAIHALGLLLVNNPEFAGSPDEAAALLQQSSLAGCWRSTVVLGILAREHDPSLAFYYFHLATLQGGGPAQRLVGIDLAALERRITPAEKTARAAEADKWFQQHRFPLLFVFREKERNQDFPLTAVSDYNGSPHVGQ